MTDVRVAGRSSHHHQVRQLTLALLPGVAFLLVFTLRAAQTDSGWRFTLFDDALISMAYGRTLAQTGEWVWFPGADRVQGITNPLWSFVMAGVHVINSSPAFAIPAITLIGSLLVLGTAVFGYASLLAAGGTRRAALAVAGLVPFLYPLTFWSLRGMEVGLLALLTSVLVFAALRIRAGTNTQARIWSAVAAAVALASVLTRLDALVGVVAIAAVASIASRTRRWRYWAIVAAVALLGAVLVTLFQGLYWGDLLPNTYHLKVEGVPLNERITRGAFATAKALPLTVLALVAWQMCRRHREDAIHRRACFLVTLCLAVVLSSTLYSVWTGGDAWEWSLFLNRTLSVALPIALLGWMAASHVVSSVPRSSLIALAVSGVGLGMSTNPNTFDLRIGLIGLALTTAASALVGWAGTTGRSTTPRVILLGIGFVLATSAPGALLWVTNSGLNVVEDQQFAARADQLKAVTDPKARIAVMWAGAPGYFSERTTIDMFGKSDRVIARGEPSVDPETGEPFPFIPGHNKWNYEYSIEAQRPDVVFQLGPDRSEAQILVEAWGYVPRCLDDGWRSYFRADSELIRWEQLRDC